MRARVTPEPPDPEEAGGRGSLDEHGRLIGWDGKTPVPMARDVLTDDELRAYLDAIEAGAGRALAARNVGKTASFMRRLRRRDEAFRALVEDAERVANEVYLDRLQAQARIRAMESDRILEVELATHLPQYRHLRRDRVQVDARMEHAIVLNPEVLDAMPVEKLLALRALLVEAGGGIIEDGEFTALPPGQDEGGDGDAR